MNKKNYIVIGLIILLAVLLTISDYKKSIANNNTLPNVTEFKVMEGDKIVNIIDNKYYLVENYNEGETIYHLYDKDRNDIFKDKYAGDIVYANYYKYNLSLTLIYQTVRNPYPILSLCGENSIDSNSIVLTKVSIQYENGKFETPEVIETQTAKEFLKNNYSIETCEELMTSTDPNLVFEKNALMSENLDFNIINNGFTKVDYIDENTKFENVPIEIIYEPRDKETEQIYGKELYLLINGKIKISQYHKIIYNDKYILTSCLDYDFSLYDYEGNLLLDKYTITFFGNYVFPDKMLSFGYKILNNKLYFIEANNSKYFFKYVDLNSDKLTIVTVKEVYGHTGG